MNSILLSDSETLSNLVAEYLLVPIGRRLLEPQRSIPPQLVLEEFRWQETSRGTVCWIVQATDVIPLLRWISFTIVDTRLPTNVEGFHPTS